jgi:tRNA threonylcarbamoyladenosine biosynthesis protein TsaB
VLGLLPAKRRPPEKTWWAQVLDKGRGLGEPIEAGEVALQQLADGVDVVCGALSEVPDLGAQRLIAKPTAGAAAIFATWISGGLPPPRPVYVREPDAKPMGAKPMDRP